MSEPTASDHGFRSFEPVRVSHQGSVRVYESSDAMVAALWLDVHDPDVSRPVDGHSTVLVPLPAAEQIRDQLTWFLENHYQIAAHNPLDLCAACDGTGTAPHTADPCRACTGQRRGPRRWRIGDAPPPDDVICVADHTAEGHAQNDDDGWTWGRTTGDRNEWKGYKNGGKTYLGWAELVRRWGPVAEVPR